MFASCKQQRFILHTCARVRACVAATPIPLPEAVQTAATAQQWNSDDGAIDDNKKRCGERVGGRWLSCPREGDVERLRVVARLAVR